MDVETSNQNSGESQPTEEQWTDDDQAKLEAELAAVEFDPAHAIPGLRPDRSALIGGVKVQIHDVYNFPMILGVVDKLLHGQETPPEPSFEALFVEVADERKYKEIFSQLATQYPALYKKVRMIDARRPAVPETELDQTQEDYENSQAYTAAARIAQALDQNYPLANLVKRD